MQFADGLYSRGLYDMAISEYLKLLRSDAGYEKTDVALYRLGESYRRLGQPDVARRMYLRLAKEHPGSAYRQKAELRRAEVFVTGGRYVEASGLFAALLDEKPDDEVAASALYYLGYSARRADDGKVAEKAFRKLLADYPKSPYMSYACLELVEMMDGSHSDKEKLELLERASEHPASDRVAAEALFKMGELAFTKADYEKSAEAYGRLLKEHPADMRAKEAALQTAWSLHHVGKYADAAELIEDNRGTIPDDALAEWLYLEANCLRQLMRYDEAQAIYERLLREYPDDRFAPAAHYESALIAFKQGRHEDVIRLSKDLDAPEGLDEDLQWLLAESYSVSEDHDKAIQYYRMIIKSFPDSEQAPNSIFRIGSILQKREDFAAASETFRELAAKYPEHDLAGRGLFASGFCMTRAGDYSEAVKDWGELIERFPEHELVEEALFQKGLAEIRLGHTRKGPETLNKLLADFPETSYAAQAHYWLGIIADEKEYFDAATAQFKQALAASPAADLADRTRFRLAATLQKQGKPDEAADLVEELLESKIKSDIPPSLLEWLARHRLEQGRLEGACKAASVLVKQGDSEAWKQIGWYLQGLAQAQLGLKDKAVAAFESAMKADANTREGSAAALELGVIYRKSHDYEKSVAALTTAGETASEPDLADIRARSYYNLGLVALEEEAWEEAARYFMSVGILFDDPELTPECLARAAECFAKINKPESRDAALDELKKRYPGSKWARP
ncbi:MAG: tetratricopeptide repeat protein [Verrucomicrobia bacterium]|nr:tetratricopeptide repeat protein [Verrucomicrobiota bacterium]